MSALRLGPLLCILVACQASPVLVPPLAPPPSGQDLRPLATAIIDARELGVVARLGDGRPVAGARVEAFGPSLTGAATGSNGLALLDSLVPGAGYRIRIEAAGFATQERTEVRVDEPVPPDLAFELRPEGQLAGRVVGPGGAPLPGAVVSDGMNATLTDATGRFRLLGAGPGPLALSASKIGYGMRREDLDLAPPRREVLLELMPMPASFYLEERGRPRFQTARAELVSRGWRLADHPPEQGVWILAGLQASLPIARREEALAFVARGGKLLVLGEWGGAEGFDAAAANDLVHALGLHFNPDLVRGVPAGEGPGALRFPSESFRPSAPGLRLFATASLFGLPPMETLVASAAGSLRVLAEPRFGPHPVLMGGPYGRGKAIAVGGGTAFSDARAEPGGTARLSRGDNLAFLDALLAW